ncbi:MAG: heavy-metal-associated domain-containing protein, partial [Candidatus Rokubacteria bacterium]|nr:heavy-metal-associated domain-containing protein [Candidatus Rokubacteria bacterium]
MQRVAVDLDKGQVTVLYEDDLTSPPQLAKWLKAAGFPTNGQ